MGTRRAFLEMLAAMALSAPGGAALARGPGGGPSAGAGRADASQMALSLARGQVTATRLVATALQRLDAIAGAVNPVVSLDAERALAAARAADAQRAARPSAPAPPLVGLPMLVKDNVEERGQRFTHGSRAQAERIGMEDAPYVLAMRMAGLISLGRSTLPELALLPTTESDLTGPTRNPWNPAHSAGGSSGGSGVAVAAGAVPFAHANDGGGSIRIPASVLGLVGLKPSRGRLAGAEQDRGVTALSVQGCLSRTVRDTAAWLAATESRAGPLAPVGPVVEPGAHRLRIAVRTHGGAGEADPDVLAAVETVRRELERLGHRLVDAPPPFEPEATAIAFERLWAADTRRRIGLVAQWRRSAGLPFAPEEMPLEPATLGFARLAEDTGEAALGAAVSALEAMSAAELGQFDSHDLLLTPTLGTAPPPIGHLSPHVPFGELQARLRRFVAFTPIENATGSPALALPAGLSPAGLPIGVQLVAPPGGERLLLELGYRLEAVLDWGRARPRVFAQ